MKVVIGTNVLDSIRAAPYTSHMLFHINCGMYAEKNDIQIYASTPERMNIDGMRNFTGRKAISKDIDYILFIDDDVIVPTKTLEGFVERAKEEPDAIIAGVTFVRGGKFDVMAYRTVKDDEEERYALDPLPQEEIKGEDLIPVDAVGFSCCWVPVKLLKEMESPWFVTGLRNTEDIYFCIRAKQELDAKIFLDPCIQTTHLLQPEGVSMENVEELKARFGVNGINETASGKDRGRYYLQEVKDVIERSRRKPAGKFDVA